MSNQERKGYEFTIDFFSIGIDEKDAWFNFINALKGKSAKQILNHLGYDKVIDTGYRETQTSNNK